MSILGVVMFIASRSPSLVVPVAVMGAATFAGTVLPAVPYLWCSGWVALAQSAVACLLVALAVGRLRSWRPHRYIETTAVIAVGITLTVACNLVMPGGAT
jgi:hypothetical protein